MIAFVSRIVYVFMIIYVYDIVDCMRLLSSCLQDVVT